MLILSLVYVLSLLVLIWILCFQFVGSAHWSLRVSSLVRNDWSEKEKKNRSALNKPPSLFCQCFLSSSANHHHHIDHHHPLLFLLLNDSCHHSHFLFSLSADSWSRDLHYAQSGSIRRGLGFCLGFAHYPLVIVFLLSFCVLFWFLFMFSFASSSSL